MASSAIPASSSVPLNHNQVNNISSTAIPEIICATLMDSPGRAGLDNFPVSKQFHREREDIADSALRLNDTRRACIGFQLAT